MPVYRMTDWGIFIYKKDNKTKTLDEKATTYLWRYQQLHDNNKNCVKSISDNVYQALIS